ncbi:DUF4325 domain-containing protein [Billgrantia pellis]|uniref:DUF4325 domain-containing protein n=2 Tax=Billgrantia pellis TaxID=2606936 RepID=A0A7V7KFS3_9GAMM|nr:DUF4325 domain-containing protein [Halomonas pellis]
MKTIELAKVFSRYPAGRYKSDGPFSGEKFREEMLLPFINNEDLVVIVLDGAMGYGSSFLEEAFGGLVRKLKNKDIVKKKLVLVSKEDPFLVKEINSYIEHGLDERNA